MHSQSLFQIPAAEYAEGMENYHGNILMLISSGNLPTEKQDILTSVPPTILHQADKLEVFLALLGAEVTGELSLILSKHQGPSCRSSSITSTNMDKCVFPMERPILTENPGIQIYELLALWNVFYALVMSPSKNVRKSTAPIDTPASILKN